MQFFLLTSLTVTVTLLTHLRTQSVHVRRTHALCTDTCGIICQLKLGSSIDLRQTKNNDIVSLTPLRRHKVLQVCLFMHAHVRNLVTSHCKGNT